MTSSFAIETADADSAVPPFHVSLEGCIWSYMFTQAQLINVTSTCRTVMEA